MQTALLQLRPYIKHTLPDILMQRIYQLGPGYELQSDNIAIDSDRRPTIAF